MLAFTVLMLIFTLYLPSCTELYSVQLALGATNENFIYIGRRDF